MLTIKDRIRFSMMVVSIVIGIVLTGTNVYQLYRSSLESATRTTIETARAYSLNLSNEIKLISSDLNIVSRDSIVRNADMPASQREARLGQLVEGTRFSKMDIAGAAGLALNGVDIADRVYYLEAKAGRTFITGPLVNRDLGNIAILASAPMVNEVIFGTIDYSHFADIISQIQVGETGYGFMVDSNGTIIAHPDEQHVIDFTNYITLAEQDAGYAKQAAAISEMIAGGSGTTVIQLDGKTVMLSYAPIDSNEGWTLGVVYPRQEYMQSLIYSLIASAVILIVLTALAAIYSTKISSSIAEPVASSTQRIGLLAQGDLSAPVPAATSKDETGKLLQSLGDTIMTVNGYISEISDILTGIASGDLTRESEQVYLGDFAPIGEALVTITGSLNAAFADISTSAEQVEQGAAQISSGAQGLSQITMEQAATIEELSASLAEISAGIQEIAKNAEEARAITARSGENVQTGNQQMGEMLEAMGEIDHSSNEISKIIKVINDIAFQTNILALNAAVEAARAGAAGKGFAVVADEVRNLASKSAEAAKETTALIEESISSVKKGTKMAQRTARSLEAIASDSEGISNLVSRISEATNDQATAVVQINQGMEQMSGVVQTSSATAQQSAASSEELNSQAEMLKTLIEQFRLK